MSFRTDELAAATTLDAAERPQVLTNAAISALEADLLRRGEMESFPGVPLPSGDDLSEAEKLRFLKRNDMEELMLERAPFFHGACCCNRQSYGAWPRADDH